MGALNRSIPARPGLSETTASMSHFSFPWRHCGPCRYLVPGEVVDGRNVTFKPDKCRNDVGLDPPARLDQALSLFPAVLRRLISLRWSSWVTRVAKRESDTGFWTPCICGSRRGNAGTQRSLLHFFVFLFISIFHFLFSITSPLA